MTELYILIVEDSSVSALSIEILLTDLGYSNFTIVKSAEEALNSINQMKPDVILLDIELDGEMDGILMAEQLRGKNIPVIFTTAFGNDQTYQKAKTVEPYAYLTKPINKATLAGTIDSVTRHLRNLEEQSTQKESESLNIADEIFIRAANKLVKLRITDILAIEAEGNYCTFYTTKKKLVVKQSLARVKKKLAVAPFLQIHRNYIIQSTKINSVSLTTNEVLMEDYRFPIGGKYRSHFLAQLKKL